MATVRVYKVKLAEKEKTIERLEHDKESLSTKLKDALAEIEELKMRQTESETHISTLQTQLSAYQSKSENLKEILGNIERLCSHKKKEFFTKNTDFQCDNCHQTQPKGAKMYGCRECNLDYCQKCGGDPDLRVYHFERNSKRPWGVAVDFEDNPMDKWKITRIEQSSQFATKGVQVGWRISKVNRYKMEEKNRKKVEEILRAGKKCIIEFDIAVDREERRAMKSPRKNPPRDEPKMHMELGKVQLAGTWYKAAIASSQMATILESKEAEMDDVVGRVIRNLRPALVSYKNDEGETGPKISIQGPAYGGLMMKQPTGWGNEDGYHSGSERPGDSNRLYLKPTNGTGPGSFYTDSVTSEAPSTASLSLQVGERMQSQTVRSARNILNRKSVMHPGPAEKIRAEKRRVRSRAIS